MRAHKDKMNHPVAICRGDRLRAMVLPLSAIITCPCSHCEARKARALEMQLARVPASLRRGITISH
jgi:hypothetical protein